MGFSQVVFLEQGWENGLESYNTDGLLRLLGLRGLCSREKQWSLGSGMTTKFLPRPMTSFQETIWLSFLYLVCKDCEFKRFDGVRPPTEILTLLASIIRNDIFPHLSILTNPDHGENMLVGTGISGQTFPLARWCSPHQSLIQEEDVIKQLQEDLVHTASWVKRMSIDLRLKLLEACWRRHAEIQVFAYTRADIHSA